MESQGDLLGTDSHLHKDNKMKFLVPAYWLLLC